jgi:acetoacetyl-CoA synthetase
MPGAEWFPGARLSYAEHAFRGRRDDEVAIRHASELRPLGEWTWGELRASAGAVAAALREAGVEAGDRVAAYLPNIPETIAAFLGCASIGATWSSCAPEFGVRSVVDRFAQIEPKVLLAVDGYRYGGKDFDRSETIAALQRELPTVERTLVAPYLAGGGWELEPAEPEFAQLPFDHPLWVLYSSGTTGLPKAIVHGQGGILLEHLKKLRLHLDAREGDRLFWFTTTGWMMWNFLVGGLLSDASIVLFDGNPAYPDLGTLWDLADAAGITCFGTSAGYVASCHKAGVDPRAGRDLSRLDSIGSTGSPLAPEGFDWVREKLGEDVWLFSTSGGTDVCTAFVGGVPTLPVYRGELQARALGAKVEAWSEDGRPLVNEVGELVITEPMPSMPLYLWGDEDGSRYRESYFSTFPGVWRHGDWIEITDRGTAIITGRSDATINRGGVRMGTSELYRSVLALDDVLDALVVDVPQGDGSRMTLFVVLREGAVLDDRLEAEIRRRIRDDCSPRHVPDEVLAAPEIPRTLSGKILEVPVKRILMGASPDAVASRDSLANPGALAYFEELAAVRAKA